MEKIFCDDFSVFHIYSLSSSMVFMDNALFVIDLVKTKLKHWPLFVGLLVTFVGMITFFDSGLSIGLFSAINPSLYNLSPFWNLLGLNVDINMFRSLLHTVFVGISAYYIYEYA